MQTVGTDYGTIGIIQTEPTYATRKRQLLKHTMLQAF